MDKESAEKEADRLTVFILNDLQVAGHRVSDEIRDIIKLPLLIALERLEHKKTRQF